MKIKPFPVLFLFLAFFSAEIYAEVKPPVLKITALDMDSNIVITNFNSDVRKISENEKKGEAFIFKISMRADGYNQSETTIDVPYAYRGKEFQYTNYMTAYFAPVITNVAPPVQIKKTNITISGQIMDKKNIPVPDVLVQCLDGNYMVVSNTWTGMDGRYIFTNMPPQKYIIRTKKDRELTGKLVAIPRPTKKPVEIVSNKRVLTNVQSRPIELKKIPLDTNSIKLMWARDQRVSFYFYKKTGLIGVIPAIKKGNLIVYISPLGSSLSESDMPTCVFTNYVIKLVGTGLAPDGKPLIQDLVPFDLLLYAVYSDGTFDKKPYVLGNIISKDITPPFLPLLDYVNFTNGSLILEWHRGKSDHEPLAYRIYYKYQTNFILLGSVNDYTTNFSLKSREIRIPDTMTSLTNIYMTITAVDLSGNESEYKESMTIIEKSTNLNIHQDIVLEKSDVYIYIPPQPVIKNAVKKNVKLPFNYQMFVNNGYKIPGECTLSIKNRSIAIPEGVRIVVSRNSKLILENVVIRGAGNGSTWQGISLYEKAGLVMNKTIISNASCALSAVDGSFVNINRSRIIKNKTGLYSHSSDVRITASVMSGMEKSVYAVNSSIVLQNCRIISNLKAGDMVGCSVAVKDCVVEANGSSLSFMRSKVEIMNNGILRNKGYGIHLVNSSGNIRNCSITYNSGDGISCEAANPLIEASDIYGNYNYGITGGGVVLNCFVGCNNHSREIDNTPDQGSADGKPFSFSNQSIQQITGVDMIKNLKKLNHFSLKE